jgi:hypothetical protein
MPFRRSLQRLFHKMAEWNEYRRYRSAAFSHEAALPMGESFLRCP